MSAFLVMVVYLAAICIPVGLLYYFHARSWYWHGLAIVAALGLGFMPTPAGWDTVTMSLVFGFVFTFLMIWGIGGLILFRPRAGREKHA